jgi:hypothetical protein
MDAVSLYIDKISKMVETKDKQIQILKTALQQYADKENWGYYDDSGCPKGYGKYDSACFLGMEPARNALEEIEEIKGEKSV